MGLEEAISGYGLSKLARTLGISPQRLNNWRTIGVPLEWCPRIEAATGVSRESLRADIDWLAFDRPCQACARMRLNRTSRALRKRMNKGDRS